MRSLCLWGAALILVPASVSAQASDLWSEALNISPQAVETIGVDGLRIRSTRVLTAQTARHDLDGVQMRNVLISSPGRGDVFSVSIKAPDPHVITALLQDPYKFDCAGPAASVDVRGLSLSADPDAEIAGANPESVFIEAATISILIGDGCFGVGSFNLNSLLSSSAQGDELRVAQAHGQLIADDFKVGLRDLVISSAAGLPVLTADEISVGGDSVTLRWGHASIKNLRVTPKYFLYADLLRRAGWEDLDGEVSVDASLNYTQDTITKIRMDVRAARLMNLFADIELTGDDVFGDPLSAAFKYANISFEDLGVFDIFQRVAGVSVSEKVRSGDFLGLPDAVRSARLNEMRSGLADWVEVGRGDAVLAPPAPVPFAMIGAAMAMFPKTLPSVLNISINVEQDKEKP